MLDELRTLRELRDLKARSSGLFSGKRKVIEHVLSPDVMVGVDVMSEEERRKREARAAKFGVKMTTAPAVQPSPAEAVAIIDASEVETRNKRAKKFALDPVDPLAEVHKAAPPDAFWSTRRDVGPDETPRPEAVHIFGTDRMSTEDCAPFPFSCGLTEFKRLMLRWNTQGCGLG